MRVIASVTLQPGSGDQVKYCHYNLFEFHFFHLFTLRLFQWKTLCEDSFPYFPMFDNIKKKMSQKKTIFGQRKKYDLFLKIVFH